MIAVLYFIVFLFLWLRYRRNARGSVGALLLFFYLASAFISLLISLSPSYSRIADLGFLSTLYYLACVLVSLIPFLSIGKLDSRDFHFSNQLLRIVTVFLVVSGVVEIVDSLIFISNNWSVFLTSISTIRDGFYETLGDTTQGSTFERILQFARPFQYMSPFCCFYFLTKNNKNLAFWSFVASISVPLHGMTIGERESILVFFSNYAFCYFFFRSELHDKTRKKVKRFSIIASLPFVVYVVAMSLSRFGSTREGALHGLMSYGGNQPYFFSYLFNRPDIEAQKLGGRFCFQYLFPVNERAWRQLNEYISADEYLNQFGGGPGSLFLDFGYETLLIVVAVALAYYLLIRNSKMKGGKHPFYLMFVFYFSFQVLFMNIFYLDYIYIDKVFLSFVFFIACVVFPQNEVRRM
jgi:hypothetical protein